MKMNNKQLLANLRRASYAELVYKNQRGLTVAKPPPRPTVNLCAVGSEPALHLDAYPGETMLQRAHRRKLLDVWTPCVKLVMSNGHTLRYTGPKAEKIWSAWKGVVYNG